jgi:hypothetical protein
LGSRSEKLQAQFTSLWALAGGGVRLLDTVDLTLSDVVRAVSRIVHLEEYGPTNLRTILERVDREGLSGAPNRS